MDYLSTMTAPDTYSDMPKISPLASSVNAGKSFSVPRSTYYVYTAKKQTQRHTKYASQTEVQSVERVGREGFPT
jgi:hypothetical protein